MHDLFLIYAKYIKINLFRIVFKISFYLKKILIFKNITHYFKKRVNVDM